MKNKIKLYLTLWIILFAFLSVNAQCETIMKFFKDDMYTSKELVAFVENDPQKAFDSWKVLYNEKKGLTKNLEDLNLVSKNLDEINKAGGYLKWKLVQQMGKVHATSGEELLALGKNILEGSDEMLQTAKTKIAQYRADMKGIKKLGGNLGYVEGEINGAKLSDELVSSGAAPANTPEIFNAKYVNSQNQIKPSDIEGAYLRTGDSEFQMLTNVAEKFNLENGKVYTQYTGTIKVVSELPYCASCSGVIHQFSNMIPNVKIIIVNGAK